MNISHTPTHAPTNAPTHTRKLPWSQELMAEAKKHKKQKKVDYSIMGMVSLMSDWMIDFLQNNGFWGVLLFSS